MSLYSDGEICAGCPHAVFHEECCRKFCKCEVGAEKERDHIVGECEYRKANVQED